MTVTPFENLKQRRYTDEEKEQVRQVWTFRANRNAGEVVRLLNSKEFAELNCQNATERTVRLWAKEGEWDDRANREIWDGAASLRYLAQSELVMGAPEATRFLRRAVALAEEHMMKPMVTKDGEVVTDQDGRMVLQLDDRVFRVGVQAAQLLLDRAGFSPVGTREGLGALDSPPVRGLEATNYDLTTPEGVQAYEEEARRKAGLAPWSRQQAQNDG